MADLDAIAERYADGPWDIYNAEDGHRSIRVHPDFAVDLAWLVAEVRRLRAVRDAASDLATAVDVAWGFAKKPAVDSPDWVVRGEDMTAMRAALDAMGDDRG